MDCNTSCIIICWTSLTDTPVLSVFYFTSGYRIHTDLFPFIRDCQTDHHFESFTYRHAARADEVNSGRVLRLDHLVSYGKGSRAAGILTFLPSLLDACFLSLKLLLQLGHSASGRTLKRQASMAGSSSTSPPSSTSKSPTQTTPSVSLPATLPSRPSSSTKAAPLNAGSTAGLGVGLFFAGALIAAVLVWFFMERRFRKKRTSSSEKHLKSRTRYDGNANNADNSDKPLPLVSTISGQSFAEAGRWENHLPQPISDGNIGNNFRSLLEHIAVHVENFYRDSKVDVVANDVQTALTDPKLGVGLPDDLPDSLVSLLTGSSRPTNLIKHCIARSILAHISADSNIPDSFLPGDFVALPSLIKQQERSSGGGSNGPMTKLGMFSNSYGDFRNKDLH